MCSFQAALVPLLAVLCATAARASLSPDPDTLFAQGRFDAADSLYARILARTPDDTLATLRRGVIALYENRLDAAQSFFTEAIRQAPTDARRHSLLAEVHRRRDDFPASARELRLVGRDVRAAALEDFGTRRPYRIVGDSTLVPLLQTDPLPLIEASVNGSAPVRLLIDTGAAEIVLDPVFADSIHARRFGKETGTFAGDKKADVERGRVDSVRIGRLVVHDVPVAIQDTRRYAAIARGQRVDGIVGTSFLAHFLATLDYPRGVLVLRARGGPAAKAFRARPAANEITVPFWLAGDHFMVAWGTLNRGPQRLWFVDTGLAGGGFTCPRSTLDESGVSLANLPSFEGIGGGGKVSATPFVADRLTLGRAEATKVTSFFGPFPESLEWLFGFRIGGIISHGFFRAFALTLDFDATRLYLAPG